MSTRDYHIDLLRFIGISLIILAHISPPQVIFQVRSFDVPLMIFVSGYVYANKVVTNYRSFIISRVKRLCFPVWIFLTFYLLPIYCLQSLLKTDWGITFRSVLESYLLLDGIGFVWIIRVFLLIALITPILILVAKYFQGIKTIYFSLLILTGITIQSVLIYYGIGMKYLALRDVIYYMSGYSLVFLVGCYVKNCSYQQRIYSAIFWSVILFLSCLYYFHYASNGVIPLNNYKYPPYAYFLIYGLFMSIFLEIVLGRKNLKSFSWVSFIGSGTIWIYLYHIPLIHLTSIINIETWYYRFIIVYVGAVFFYFLQYKIVGILEQKYPQIKISKYLKG